ncbi:MAG: GIY-YIG nuclease family protein [Gemmatimonadaceae bacterium]|nr:GIY-YIG nuclease family protein [Chitinophagaceae bacterium]
MYAIVDIETTGGHASANGITEVAIVLHNGRETEGKYHTLINPGIPIPRYITALTGISNEMVYGAPTFAAVATQLFNLLQGRVFVAHNVNFDFSFLRHHFAASGLDFNAKKLCTVRMARKVLPGYPSYSLGKICGHLGIEIIGRHRAMGDAEATVCLFEKVLAADKDGAVVKMLGGRTGETYLPPNLSAAQIENLPATPGVYYFYDRKGKIVYVGKATNLRQRVRSHFSNNDAGRRKQDFLKNIFSVSHNACTSELSALIFESIEIRRLWPLYNRSQKRYHHEYGLYTYEDQNGYLRLFIERKKKNLTAVYTFNLLHEGQIILKKMVEEHRLDETMCFIDRSRSANVSEKAEQYNARVKTAIATLEKQLPTFLVTDCDHEKPNYILMEKGRFTGMGSIPQNVKMSDISAVKEHITSYPDNDYIRGLVYQFAEKFPERKIEIFS